MVLSLVTPIGSNFIKDWPSQNQVNCDLIDGYAGPSLHTHPINSYTPQVLSTTTAPTLGTGGLIRGFYYRIFDQIYTWGEFRFGTAGISAGSGIWSVSLPFAATSPISGGNGTMARAPILGNGFIWDDSAAATRMPLIVQLRSSTEIQFGVKMGSGAGAEGVGSTIPITWAINDGIMWSARYKRAA